ncbi:hypothetical protein Tco_0702245 [Tanacetum coccineum]|uniref:Uncharacterized protein n=2 Tax=Tanacetum coccineum TaxID=301880 RepID=A0ABQ4XVR6_9ASTR
MQTQESKIDTGKALDANLVDTESIRTDSKVQDDSSRSGNDTDADDADIRPIYDENNVWYPETCQVKSPMLDSSPDNQTTEYSKQSLESENILLKETVANFKRFFKKGSQSLQDIGFSPNKTSAVYEKTSPRSDLRWKPTGRIFKSVGLRWIPTGKLFDSCTSKGKMPTKIELTLEQSQQGVSNDVLVSIEGVEE